MTSSGYCQYLVTEDILKNFQPVIQKIFEAGLKQLAQASGFRSATLTALSNSSNFHITHSFVLQAYEAIYRSYVGSVPLIQPRSGTSG